MSSFRLELNQQAIADLALRGDGIRNLVARKTEAAASALAGEVGAENVSAHVGGINRVRGTVRRLGPRALADEVVDGALGRSLGSAR